MIKAIWCWVWGHAVVGKKEEPRPDGPGKITRYYLAPFCKRCGKQLESNPESK